MANILIQPIICSTIGGYPAKITGISPGITDQIVGEVTLQSGVCKVSWDINGTCRDQPHDLNLDSIEGELAEVVFLARALSKLCA